MYSRIIVPLDGSELAEQALPYAQLVARSLSASIELIQAFDILPPGLMGEGSQFVVDQMLAGARDRAESYLYGTRLRLEAEGNSVSTTAMRSSPAEAIVAQASIDPSALVVMSTHGRGGIARWVLGSVADKVLHTVPNPMLVVRAAGAQQAAPADSLKMVVVPLDGSQLAELAIPHAASIAAALSARITLLRVTPTLEHYQRDLDYVPYEIAGVSDYDQAPAERLVESDTQQVATYLSGVESRLAGVHTHGVSLAHERNDDVAQAIIDQAGEEQSLVVMTTHGRSGVGRMVFGSVADRVVRHSNAPVLVVR